MSDKNCSVCKGHGKVPDYDAMARVAPKAVYLSKPCPNCNTERGAINHFLKIWPKYFEEVITGRKTFEIRSTEDRHFQEGDTLTLQMWDPATKSYSGRETTVIVTYVLAEGVLWHGKPAAVMGIHANLFSEGM